MTDGDDDFASSPPLTELAQQMIYERTRPRPRKPTGFKKSEIPGSIASTRTLDRIESGTYRGMGLGKILELLDFYDTEHQQVDQIKRLVRAAKADDWCSVYSDAVDDKGWFYQQREDAASDLFFHSGFALPSLIHGEAYYERIVSTTEVHMAEVDGSQNPGFRLERRRRWIASERPAQLLIHQAALTIDLGPKADEIHADLRKMVTLPFADVRVIPFNVGRYDLMGYDMSLLEFDGGGESIVQVESSRGSGLIKADSARGKFFIDAYKRASAKSIPAEEFLR
ncbi:Scr1 family TA system antitoxin-like transcriptional regulator [Glycomyces harbinensis]|uniref:Scr1 family TA system antitoxin-like transcriptional regulator n=1 Tax=Glycomyces harbinensis TaxID=58114 RepID=UPI0024DE14B4|nr:Scr1 family TA system antitoxin-like transcriptional regulator [Glycomyces harbinensis]